MASIAPYIKTPVVLLSEHCENANLPPPLYNLTKTHSDTPRYRCTVSVGKYFFNSSKNFAIPSDARHSVAREAFLVLIGELELVQENDEQSNTGEDVSIVRRYQRAFSADKLSACDFKSSWGNINMPWWTNLEILQERIKNLNGYNYRQVLSEVAKFNGIPLNFKLNSTENQFNGKLDFHGRSFSAADASATECKEIICKKVILSLLGKQGPKVPVVTGLGTTNYANTNNSTEGTSIPNPISEPNLNYETSSSFSSSMLYSEIASLNIPTPSTASITTGTTPVKPPFFESKKPYIEHFKDDELDTRINKHMKITYLKMAEALQALAMQTSIKPNKIPPEVNVNLKELSIQYQSPQTSANASQMNSSTSLDSCDSARLLKALEQRVDALQVELEERDRAWAIHLERFADRYSSHIDSLTDRVQDLSIELTAFCSQQKEGEIQLKGRLDRAEQMLEANKSEQQMRTSSIYARMTEFDHKLRVLNTDLSQLKDKTTFNIFTDNIGSSRHKIITSSDRTDMLGGLEMEPSDLLSFTN